MRVQPETAPTPAESERFASLARCHYGEVLRSARRISGAAAIAEDLVQDAFVAAFKNFHRYDPARSFIAWMRAIVRHRWLRYLTDRRRCEIAAEPAAIEDMVEHGDVDHLETIGGQEKRALLPLLAECIRALPAQLRSAVELSYFQNLSGADIAIRMDLSEGNVRQRLHRGRRQLRQLMTARMKCDALALAA